MSTRATRRRWTSPKLPDFPGASVAKVNGSSEAQGGRLPEAASPAVRRLARMAALALAGFAAVCWALVAALGALPGDAHTAAEVREDPLGPVALAPAHALDWLGSPLVAVPIAAVVAALTWRALGPRYALLAIGMLGASVITAVIKAIAERPRPIAGLHLDPSFPSGHTTVAAAVLGFATLLAVQQRRLVLAVLLAAVVAAMGPSRVLLGVHWLSDVLAGYAIGFAWLITMLLVGLPWARRSAEPR